MLMLTSKCMLICTYMCMSTFACICKHVCVLPCMCLGVPVSVCPSSRVPLIPRSQTSQIAGPSLGTQTQWHINAGVEGRISNVINRGDRERGEKRRGGGQKG